MSTTHQIQSPGFLVWRVGVPKPQDAYQKEFYEKVFATTALVIFSSTLAFAQSAPPARDTDNTATRYNDEPRHNWSWIGLLGLAGLAGLRPRKSESAERFESRGVKVKAV